MADQTDLLAQLLLGSTGKAAIAAEDPYLGFQKEVSDPLSQLILGATGPGIKTKDKIIGGLLTGLLSGIAGGASEDYQTRANKAYQDVIQKSILAGPDSLLQGSPEITRPDVLSPSVFDTAKQNAQMFSVVNALKQKDAQQEYDLARQGKFEDALLKSGYLKDPKGNLIKIDALDPIEQEKAKALALKGTKDWWDEVPVAVKQNISQLKGLSSKLNDIASLFDNYKGNWAQYQATKDIAGTEANKLMTQVLSLVPTTARMLGEVGNLAQQEQERIISSTLGNFTSNPENIADRLRALAKNGLDIGASRLESFKTGNTEGGDALLNSLKSEIVTPSSAATPDLSSFQAEARAILERRRRGVPTG